MQPSLYYSPSAAAVQIEKLTLDNTCLRSTFKVTYLEEC